MPTKLDIARTVAALGGTSFGGFAIYDGATQTDYENILLDEHISNNLYQDNIDSKLPKAITYKLKSGVVLTNDYKNKVLDTFKKQNLRYIVIGNEERNKDWWEWSFNNRYYKENVDEIFQNIDKSYSNDSSDKQALNNACELSYKSEANKFRFGNDKHLIENIKDFCTIGLLSNDFLEPIFYVFNKDDTTVKSGENEFGVLGREENYGLFQKYDDKNEAWWSWAFKYVYSFMKQESDDALFKNISEGYSGTSNKALNQVCGVAYAKPYLSFLNKESQLLKNIKDFCTSPYYNKDLTLPFEEPKEVEFLNLDSDYTTIFAKDTDNSKRLVHPKKSEKWWKWIYYNHYLLDNNIEKNKLLEEFKSIQSAHSNNATGYSLNGVCSSAYKKNKEKLQQLLSTIKKYCVPTYLQNEDLNNP